MNELIRNCLLWWLGGVNEGDNQQNVWGKSKKFKQYCKDN